jgi:hypothetical protein
MTLIKTGASKLSAQPTRDALWQKRFAFEAECARRRRAAGRGAPYQDSFRARLARAVLKGVGLFDRGVRNANRPLLRQHTFWFESLPPGLAGFRILHVSDFHFNDRPGFTDMMCSLLRGVEADLCVLTGDYRYNHYAPCHSVYSGIHRLLGSVRLRRGAVAVLGNNDMSEFVPAFRAMGIRVLVNESFELVVNGHGFWLAGVDDSHEVCCASIPLAVAQVPAGAFTILLAHSPELVREAAARGIDLYLCGHTHGGQVCLPRIGPIYLNARCSRRFAAGPWRHRGLQGYTTRGIGTSTLPVRFACPPEAAIIELSESVDRSSL